MAAERHLEMFQAACLNCDTVLIICLFEREELDKCAVLGQFLTGFGATKSPIQVQPVLTIHSSKTCACPTNKSSWQPDPGMLFTRHRN